MQTTISFFSTKLLITATVKHLIIIQYSINIIKKSSCFTELQRAKHSILGIDFTYGSNNNEWFVW